MRHTTIVYEHFQSHFKIQTYNFKNYLDGIYTEAYLGSARGEFLSFEWLLLKLNEKKNHQNNKPQSEY